MVRHTLKQRYVAPGLSSILGGRSGSVGGDAELGGGSTGRGAA